MDERRFVEKTQGRSLQNKSLRNRVHHRDAEESRVLRETVRPGNAVGSSLKEGRTFQKIFQDQSILQERVSFQQNLLSFFHKPFEQANTKGSILQAVGESTLVDIVAEYLRLLETSSVVHEQDGDHACGILTSAWCRMIDEASNAACLSREKGTPGENERWNCRESCWEKAGKPAIEKGQPVESTCHAGLQLYAVPIRAGGHVMGSITFAHGNPPQDPDKLREISRRYGLDLEKVRQKAAACHVSSQFIIETAKERLQASARIIGTMVEHRRAKKELATRARYEEGLAACSQALLQGKANSIELALKHLREAADVSRIYIFENFLDPQDGVCGRQIYEVCAPGICPQIQNPILQHIPYKQGFMRWQEALSAGKSISGAVKSFPLSERQVLEPQGILSILVLPIHVCHQWYGVIGFDDTESERHWSDRDIRLLQTGAEMIGSYLERKESEKALRRSEYEKSLVLDSMNELFAHYDLDLKILWANKALINEAGLKFENMAGRRCHEVTQGLAAPCSQCPVVKARDTGQPQENEMTGPDGRVWLVRGYPILNEEGKVTSLTEFAQDITGRKQAEADRLALERQLLHAQKLESLGVLAGGIAHDFNNILMAIHGNLELALLCLPPASAAQILIERAMGASRRAAGLTRQMLAYSGKGHFLLAPVDLGRLVEENAVLFQASFPRTTTLRMDLSRNLPMIQGDPGQIQQVVMNLITNAYEAMGETPGEVRVATEVRECTATFLAGSLMEEKPAPGPFVSVEVSDTGCGMDEDTRRRLFDPFFTTKFTGRGLGMSAVMGIVRGHRGVIFVESSPGLGTTVRVLFPLCPQEKNMKTPSPPPPVQRKVPIPSGSILVVDDEELVRHICMEYVQHLGFQVLSASNGLEGLETFRTHHQDICCVILDLNMPYLDGVSTYSQMKRINPQVPVILCSGYSEQEALQRFTKEGLSGFIQKPYRIQTLKDELTRVLKCSSADARADT